MTSDIQTPIEPIVEAPVKKVAAAVEQETAEPQPAVEASADAPAAVAVATLDESYVFVEQGKQMLALGSFDSAAEKLALAVEAQVAHLGQYSPQVADTFYLYGKALLANAVQKNTVLGEKADDQVKAAQDLQDEAVPEKAGTFVFAEEQEDEVEDDNEEEIDDGKALQDIDLVEETDDLELAWENLDVARLILSKLEDAEHQIRLGDVHIALGEVSLESENFEQAVQDFQKAVDIKISLCAEDNRERAEAHYKLALALEYSEQIEAAIEHVNLSFAVLQKRLDSLREAVDPKGKSSDVGAESTSKEAEEIETSLFPEMEAKLADLTAALEKEASGGVIGEDQEPEAAEPAVVQDISKLVKRKVDPVVEDDEAKKARIN